MAANTYVIRGTAHWAKVLGKPVPNYSKDGYEWTIDVTPNESGLKLLKELKLTDRIKDKDDARGKFIQFKQREKRANGDTNEPIKVIDPAGRSWPEDTKIGNGSVVDVKFRVQDYGPGKKKGVYPQAIRVMEHKPYESQEFAPVSEDDEYFAHYKAAADRASAEDAQFKSDFGLDDEIPV